MPNQHTQIDSIATVKDASGWQKFSYGKLGEVTKNIRTFVLPYENEPYTFTMEFEYESWNRIQRITLPIFRTASKTEKFVNYVPINPPFRHGI